MDTDGPTTIAADSESAEDRTWVPYDQIPVACLGRPAQVSLEPASGAVRCVVAPLG